MSKTLVVYYSRSGRTRSVAQTLARRLHADLDEIKVAESRQGPVGYVRCALEAIYEVTPTIRTRRDPQGYELLIVGTPVWYWSLSSPVRSFLRQVRGAPVRFAYFCTLGGSGALRVFDTMTTVTGRRPDATLALTDAEIDARDTEKLDAFVRTLQVRRAKAAAAPRTRAMPLAA